MAEYVLVVNAQDLTRLDSTKQNAELRGLTPSEAVKIYQAHQKKELVVKVGADDPKNHRVSNVWMNPNFPDRALVTFRD